jgi:hypothetical protein
MLHLNDHQFVPEDKPDVCPPATSPANATTELHFQTAFSAALDVEANWILANVTIVDAANLLTASFGKVATDATKATSHTLSSCFRQAKGTTEWKLEAEMYQPLVSSTILLSHLIYAGMTDVSISVWHSTNAAKE